MQAKKAKLKGISPLLPAGETAVTDGAETGFSLRMDENSAKMKSKGACCPCR
ncbi:MAG TPA: hypothetical protein H9715_03725 [Candidatus Merdibacter merdigallinarum]|nr:hypothetical protein [Candidatus Merdibacter merdigallinarum]